MCCIFTCCGWMIDLVQRLWTFTMSCCISSAVCCVMFTSSMSGIALGYNYSLAEYIELKETNVSIYLKRGVFDDEIVDDMDWRRSGRLPVAGHIGEKNLRTGGPADDESTTIRSGRRLDDSMFESEDQNRYEGSLMRLTAKPPYQDTEAPKVTEDMEMGELASKYPLGSIDHLKAVQNLIDSRRAMATGGTTLSPLATYKDSAGLLPYLPMNNNPNDPGNRDAQFRRMMGPGSELHPKYSNPARYAVPDVDIGSRDNWVIPKNPSLFDPRQLPDYMDFSPTYPSAITIAPSIVRPGPEMPSDNVQEQGPVIFVTRLIATTTTTVKSALIERLEKDSDRNNNKIVMEGEMPDKNEVMKFPKMGKSPEEEYEDEIKGLPVRRRRSLRIKPLGARVLPTETNINNSDSNNGTIINPVDNYNHRTITETESNKENDTYNNNFTNDDNRSVFEKTNNTYIVVKAGVDIHVKTIQEHKSETTEALKHLNENKQGTLLDRLITTIEAKKISLATEETQPNVTDKKINIIRKRKSFESQIVSSKYLPNDKARRLLDAEKAKTSNQDMLDSISISLNEAGLLKNPSSTFVKLLHSTLT